MIIPPEELTTEVIRNIAEAYIVREGTDYGAEERSLDDKLAALLPQIYSGEVLIIYDRKTDSVNLLPKRKAPSESDFA